MNKARINASFEHFRKTYEFASLKVKFCLFSTPPSHEKDEDNLKKEENKVELTK